MKQGQALMEILPGIRPKAWWEEFWRNPICGYGEPGQTLPKYAMEFYKELAQGDKKPAAVDIGSGDGRYAIALAKIGYAVDALEFTASGVERIKAAAQRESVKVNAIQGDFTILWAQDKNYDLVLSAGLIEEVDSARHRDIVRGFINWVRPGGYVLLKYCLEIQGRRQLIEENLIPGSFTERDWDIIYTEENKEMHPSRAKYTNAGGIDSAVRTGTLVARKPV